MIVVVIIIDLFLVVIPRMASILNSDTLKVIFVDLWFKWYFFIIQKENILEVTKCLWIFKDYWTNIFSIRWDSLSISTGDSARRSRVSMWGGNGSLQWSLTMNERIGLHCCTMDTSEMEWCGHLEWSLERVDLCERRFLRKLWFRSRSGAYAVTGGKTGVKASIWNNLFLLLSKIRWMVTIEL